MKKYLLATAMATVLVSCAPTTDGILPVSMSGSRVARAGVVVEGDFSFAVIGDWGSGLPAESDVADRMCGWRDNHRYDLVFTTGDNIYSYGDPNEFDTKFFEPHACLLDAGVQWHAALGNHDIATDGGEPEIADANFGMKGRNYVVREQGVRFVIANSNDLNMRWLRRKTRVHEGDEWTVVFFHHPVYSGGTGHGPTPGFAEKLTPLFAKRGVDLVFNGHDHVYSVTKPVKGIRYVVTGGGGASLVGCQDAAKVELCVARHHFLYVTVDDDRMRVYAVPVKGKPFDHFGTDGI